MIFYLATQLAIPNDLMEIADIEGAISWKHTRRIVLPPLIPATLVAMVNALINSMKLIDRLSS